MTCNCAEKWLEFQYMQSKIRLQGVIQPAGSALLQLHEDQLLKWHKGNEIWATALVEPVSDVITVSPEAVPAEVQSILHKYKQVFDEPHCLPPRRFYDHTITLIHGDVAVNSRPYRYSPYQKNEIEKQIAEMLQSDLISTSVSPFASPVLLVKKKDASW